jgi:hypothetical protein
MSLRERIPEITVAEIVLLTRAGFNDGTGAKGGCLPCVKREDDSVDPVPGEIQKLRESQPGNPETRTDIANPPASLGFTNAPCGKLYRRTGRPSRVLDAAGCLQAFVRNSDLDHLATDGPTQLATARQKLTTVTTNRNGCFSMKSGPRWLP